MASKRQQEIEARRRADPVAQAIGRTDIDYSSDDLPTAPRTIYCEECSTASGVPTYHSPESHAEAKLLNRPLVGSEKKSEKMAGK